MKDNHGNVISPAIRFYKRVRHALDWRSEDLISRAESRFRLWQTKNHLEHYKGGRPHGLNTPLIVSLTSYAPRFPTLYPTLAWLLSQSVRADRTILWLTKEDLAVLPPDVQSLTAKGLDIMTSEDLKPYKKIIPALRDFPDAVIVTADDDVYYPPDWLETLVAAWNGDNRQIVCHRAHKIIMADDGLPRPYNEWGFNIRGPVLADDIFPTGIGGVLYPPGSLHTDVLDEESFMSLCPGADDIWLYFMARRNGVIYKKTKGRGRFASWPGSQKTSLKDENVTRSANDYKIKNLIDAFGWQDFKYPL